MGGWAQSPPPEGPESLKGIMLIPWALLPHRGMVYSPSAHLSRSCPQGQGHPGEEGRRDPVSSLDFLPSFLLSSGKVGTLPLPTTLLTFRPSAPNSPCVGGKRPVSANLPNHRHHCLQASDQTRGQRGPRGHYRHDAGSRAPARTLGSPKDAAEGVGLGEVRCPEWNLTFSPLKPGTP